MLVNVNDDRNFQRFLDRREQQLHVAMYPVIAQGVRLTIQRGSFIAEEQVVKRGEAVLIAHYKRVFREVYGSVDRRRLNGNGRPLRDALQPALPHRDPSSHISRGQTMPDGTVTQKQGDDDFDEDDFEGVTDFMGAQLSWIRTEAARAITRISHSLTEDIRQRVFDGVQEGWSQDKIARELANDLPDFSRNRAATIARTETHGAAMWAMDETVKYKGIEIVTKQWAANRDTRVRPSHAAMDGVTIPVDDPFETDDGDMMFPGDDSLGADAGGIINCRCAVKYFTAEAVGETTLEPEEEEI